MWRFLKPRDVKEHVNQHWCWSPMICLCHFVSQVATLGRGMSQSLRAPSREWKRPCAAQAYRIRCAVVVVLWWLHGWFFEGLVDSLCHLGCQGPRRQLRFILLLCVLSFAVASRSACGVPWKWLPVGGERWQKVKGSDKKPQEATRGQETPREDKVLRASMRHGSTWPILPDHPDLVWQSVSSKLRQSAVASEPFWPLNSALVGTFRVSGSWRVHLALKLRTEQVPSSRCVLFAFCLRSPEVRPLNMLLCRRVTSIGIKRLYRSWKISRHFSHHIAFPAVSAATLISTSRTRKEYHLLFCSPSKIWNPLPKGSEFEDDQI